MKIIITLLFIGGLFVFSEAGLSMINSPTAGNNRKRTGTVNELNPPAVSKINITSAYSNDEGLKITCEATGENLSYNWSAQNGTLRNNEVADGNILTIKQVTKENDHIFCCKAFNSKDSLTKCIRLPVLVLTSDPLERIVDSSAEIFCEVIGTDQKFDINWKRADGSPLSSNTIINGGLLTIPKLATTDTGVYVCVGLSNEKTEIFHQGISLKVLPRPDFIDVTITGLDGDSDNNVTIQCITEPDETTTYKWKAHTEGCTEGGPYLRMNEKVKNDSLLIDDFNKDNEGTFCCVATNTLGTREKCVTIKPLILEVYPKKSHEVMSGDSVTLGCHESAGHSEIEIDWARVDGQPFAPNVIKLANGSLTITNIQINEEGRYKCFATNGVASASATVDITVKSPLLSEIKISGVTRRYSATLTCQATGENISYNWTPEKGALLNNEVANGNVLTVENLTNDNYRLFCCKASNVAGTRKRCERLTETLGWYSQEKQVGSSVELECIVFGPEPQKLDAKWSREHGLPLPKDAITACNRLRIPKVAEADAGIYIAAVDYLRGTIHYGMECRIPLRVRTS